MVMPPKVTDFPVTFGLGFGVGVVTDGVEVVPAVPAVVDEVVGTAVALVLSLDGPQPVMKTQLATTNAAVSIDILKTFTSLGRVLCINLVVFY
jgi:hypothetical protein